MKTSRTSTGTNHRFSLYGENPMQRDSAARGAANLSSTGVLKRLACVMSSSGSVISRARKSTSRAFSPLVGRAQYAVNSRLSKLRAALARATHGSSHASKKAAAAAPPSPACRPEALNNTQLVFNHFRAVADIRQLVTAFSASDSDVQSAVSAMNELSKDLCASGVELHDVTYGQVTHFLEQAQACDTPGLTSKAKAFLLRAQSRAPETLEVGPYVSHPDRDREWSSKPAEPGQGEGR